MDENNSIRGAILNETLITLKKILPLNEKKNNAINEHTIIAGDGAITDSVTLVSLIVTLEQNLYDKKMLDRPLVEGFLEWLENNENVSVNNVVEFILN